MERIEFTGTLGASATGGRWIEVPFDVRAVFGQARPPVRATVNGTPLRSRLSVYGGRTYLGLRSEIRSAAGIDVGDSVAVTLELDDAPREVEVPPALAVALEHDSAAAVAFEALAFTNRREYADWIATAKRDETRERRVAKAVEMLRSGVKHP
jgi:hypothetical protein